MRREAWYEENSVVPICILLVDGNPRFLAVAAPFLQRLHELVVETRG
ncbi:MAG: hypothetical protein ACETWB_01260 [Anaerolineae bacterium]